jgi:hypothetical protein
MKKIFTIIFVCIALILNVKASKPDPITFDPNGKDYDWITFDNSTGEQFAVEANPDKTGINASSHVGRIKSLAGDVLWAGVKTASFAATSELGAMQLAADNIWLSIDVYKTDTSRFGCKYESSGTNDHLDTIPKSELNKWVRHKFYFGNYLDSVHNIFGTLTIMPNYNAGSGTIDTTMTTYFDNIRWWADSSEIKNDTIKDLPTFISEASLPEFKIYPNPANNVIKISGSASDFVTIYNLTGQSVLKVNTHNECDISGLKSGVYFIKSEGKLQNVIKLIKK